MKNALLFSYSLEGHRQIYAQHFIEALIKKDYQVYLMVDLSEVDKNHPYIAQYRAHPLVRFESISDALHISLKDLRNLQDSLSVDLTIFLDADNYISIFMQQLLPAALRLHGKNLGVFISSTNYIYSWERSPFLWNVLRFIKHIPRILDSDPFIFHEFALPRFGLLDDALVIDEHFAETHSVSHQWIPDMFFPLFTDDPGGAQAEYQYWAPQLAHFLDENRGREVLFYFGSAWQRKGYDTLLQLAYDAGCCFIHCGLSNNSEHYDSDISAMKNSLQSRGLLFETNAYVQGYRTVKLFFDTCQYMILPYRNHYGSSGIMLQAVHFGRPVLVAAQGLMGFRTQQAGLGLTYSPDNYDDLKVQWQRLKESASGFADVLADYRQNFSGEKSQQVLNAILGRINA